MHYLITALYIVGILFVISTALVVNGVGLNTAQNCHVAVYLCLAFYVSSKVMMYVFLVERAHCIRAPYARRWNDYIWCFFMLIVIAGFTVLAVFAFINPVVSMGMGGCEIGLPRRTSLILVIYDVAVNVTLTAVFIWLLQPLLKFGRPAAVPYWRQKLAEQFACLRDRMGIALPELQPYRHSLTTDEVRRREWLVCKTVWGSILVMVPTIINLAVLYHVNGHEMGWLCLLVCSTDGKPPLMRGERLSRQS
jgi:hypothetical protein